MPLQSSGAISLNDIHIIAGGSSGTTATINDADIRALIGKGSGVTMSFSEWYGVSSLSLLYTIQNPNSNTSRIDDRFGSYVAVDGDYAIAGAPLELSAAGYVGAAYIINVNTGATVHSLIGTTNSERFGQACDIEGNYAIVGASYNSIGGTASGKIYIYNVSTGALLHGINNPNAYSTSAGDRFGQSVGISGNYAIAGAYGEDDAGGDLSGKAYIFNVSTGALVHTLNNPNAYSTSVTDYFGWSVAIDGNYAIVGAYQEDDSGGSSSGKAYIFNVSTGALVHTLNNPNAYSTSNADYFGWSVAIDGNYAIVGAYQEDDAGGSNSGKAYIFNVSTGALVHTLNNPNAYSTSADDNFGISVSISGNYAVVGAYREDDSGGTQSGKAYVFNVSTGALVHTIDNPNPFGTTSSDQIAESVGISSNRIIIGAWQEDATPPPGQSGSAVGWAYIYSY